jgi:hypothetical protein
MEGKKVSKGPRVHIGAPVTLFFMNRFNYFFRSWLRARKKGKDPTTIWNETEYIIFKQFFSPI